MRTLKVVAFQLAFSCVAFAQSNPPPAVLYSTADVVFTGTLTKLTTLPHSVTAKFERNVVMKGDLPAGKDVTVRLEQAEKCHAFQENHSYLLYAQKIGDELWVDPCAGSKLLSTAEEDLRYLHTIDPQINQRCSRQRLSELAGQSPIIATAELIGTEDTLPPEHDLEFTRFWRPWCGIAWSSEDAYYTILSVLKGDIADPRIVVEHPICWDTVTVDGYYPTLSPTLFNQGNQLLLFLKPGSHQDHRRSTPEFGGTYLDVDENCGAVSANNEAVQDLMDDVRAHPEKYRYGWLDESVDWIHSSDELPESGSDSPAQSAARER